MIKNAKKSFFIIEKINKYRKCPALHGVSVCVLMSLDETVSVYTVNAVFVDNEKGENAESKREEASFTMPITAARGFF